MASTRQQILEVVIARLERITRDNGYDTDAGAAVRLGEAPAFGPDDPDEAIAVLLDDDRPGKSMEQVFIELPVAIAALARPDLAAPWVVVEQVLSDVKRAMEQTDRTLGGLLHRRMERGTTRTLPREEGSLVVGATVTYICPYVEVWGAP